ncbi:MAG: HEAT repeat domain-containing protein [Planctomycetes bacterium]|nr:HEAT repeat domain-containing protein [Planctomycetota bacterium]
MPGLLRRRKWLFAMLAVLAVLVAAMVYMAVLGVRLNALTDDLGNEDSQVRRAAVEKLAATESRIVIARLISIAADDQRPNLMRLGAMEALARMGEDAVWPLVQILHSGDKYAAQEAAMSLEMIGTAEARRAVDEFLSETDLEEVARNYRSYIGRGRDFLPLRLALERFGTIEMAADLKWCSGNGHFRQCVCNWAERKGLSEELKASKNSLDRPRWGISQQAAGTAAVGEHRR